LEFREIGNGFSQKGYFQKDILNFQKGIFKKVIF